MTTEEERNVRLSHRYEDLYNSDIKRFVDECYAADCVLNEGYIKGQARLLDIEERVLRAAPKRKMRVDARHAAGNVVVVQAVLLDPDQGPDWKLPFCAVLTCRDGKIASDWTYFNGKWPGL